MNKLDCYNQAKEIVKSFKGLKNREALQIIDYVKYIINEEVKESFVGDLLDVTGHEVYLKEEAFEMDLRL